jgi:hypothetical protein
LFRRVSRHGKKRQPRNHEQRCDDILLHNVSPFLSQLSSHLGIDPASNSPECLFNSVVATVSGSAPQGQENF